MRLCFLVVVALAAFSFASASSSPRPPSDTFGNLFREPPPPPESENKINPRLLFDRRITQKLDNFDETNTATWEMRYFANSEHYVPGGPLFIYVGGEWDISYGWIMSGHFYDMAKELNAYLFYTEHRFYGESIPTPDASTDNLKYLDINQALADLSNFIDYQKANIPGATNAGVIMVGASYAATMVTWFQQSYPGKINGVWASSAPLLAKADFVEYKEVVAKAIRQVGGDECADRIQRAILELESEVDGGSATRINSEFKLCNELSVTNQLDVWSFFSGISNRFAGVVQYHWPGNIEAVCDVIMDSSFTDDVEALANYIVGSYNDTMCYNVGYQAFVDYYSDISWESASTLSSSRQWFYQTCSEYGWYQTSESNDHIFGTKFPVELYANMCGDVYDGQFDLEIIQGNVQATNDRHKGFFPDVKNVFFTHGDIDPWHPMGVLEALNDDTPTVILTGHAHCQDLYSISDSDSEQMRETKLRVTASVRKWLGM